MGIPRTAPDSVLFTSYNLFNLFEDDSLAQREHYRQVVEVIRELGTDVLAVQEIRAGDEQTAAARMRRLAGDVGMLCGVPPGSGIGGAGGAPGAGGGGCALAAGAHGYHLGLMWRDGIEPVPGSLRWYGRGYFWHSLAMVTLDAGGPPVRFAAHHSTPFGRLARADENERLVALLAGGPAAPPTIAGADWNTESADRILDTASGTWALYEPGDPYADIDWFDELVHQCEWDYDSRGRRRHRADRRPGEVLWAGGLHDVAAILRAPWQATVGHHPDDPFGARGIRRRIDAIRATRELIPALRAHHVTDTDLTRHASDHLPVTAEYLPSAIQR